MSTIKSNTDNIWGRLKHLRKDLKLSQAAFAEKIGLKQSSYNEIETGKREPSEPVLATIAYRFSINEGWLKEGKGPMLLVEGQHEAEFFKAVISDMSASQYVQVPRYDVSASAGAGALVENEQVVDFLQFKTDWIKNALGISENNLALISVRGDSMEPTLSDGDVVLVDTTDRRFATNAIYVLQNWGSLLVKRIQRKIDGTVVIKSDNPAYDPEQVAGDMVQQLHVVGRVVWYGRRG